MSRFGKFEPKNPVGTVEGNAELAKHNRARLYELGVAVGSNKSMAYQERSSIEENRALILKNYSAAFMGNRQMANANTEQIFKNRDSLIRSVKTETQVQKNCQQALLNQSKVDYLEHRSKLNSRVAGVSDKMSTINRLLIDLNGEIMDGNAEIVAFNKNQIQKNTDYLNGGLTETIFGATPESNGKLMQSNSDRIDAIVSRAEANKAKFESHQATIDKNRADILANTEKIYARREEINANRAALEKNAARIAEFMAQ